MKRCDDSLYTQKFGLLSNLTSLMGEGLIILNHRLYTDVLVGSAIIGRGQRVLRVAK